MPSITIYKYIHSSTTFTARSMLKWRGDIMKQNRLCYVHRLYNLSTNDTIQRYLLSLYVLSKHSWPSYSAKGL